MIDYPRITATLFDYYMLGCMTALAFGIFAEERQREAILQPLVYALVIGLFEWRLHGRAHEFHYWWYWINFMADAWLVFTAVGIRAYSSKYVAFFGVLAMTADLIYFITAATRHYLPGVGYYYSSELFESLQIISMILWSGPVIPLLGKGWRMVRTLTKRAMLWHHRLAAQR